FPLSASQTVMPKDKPWESSAPHTLSVVEANQGGYRYWGYYGLQNGGNLGLAKSNDLRAWEKNPDPLLEGTGYRWPSVQLLNNTFYMVHTVGYDTNVRYSVRRTSDDGTNWSEPVILVQAEPATSENHNATLFLDPVTALFYVYWFRQPPN